ncbi:MAG: hypothetical protein ABI016_12735 [Chthoniobacterales bacterium]
MIVSVEAEGAESVAVRRMRAEVGELEVCRVGTGFDVASAAACTDCAMGWSEGAENRPMINPMANAAATAIEAIKTELFTAKT